MKTKEKRPVRNVTLIEVIFMIGFMVLALAIGNGVYRFNARLMLVFCVFVDMFIAHRCGRSWKDVMQAVGTKIGGQTNLMFLLLGLGFLMSSWVFSGTVPVIAAWLVQIIDPKYTLALTFLFGWVISFIVGSNFTTGGTICLVMYNVAMIQGLPAPIAAGAAVCGATAGSFISPVYWVPVMMAGLCGYDPKDSTKQMIPPVLLATALTTVLFTAFGFTYAKSMDTAAVAAQVEEFSSAVFTYFKPSVLILIPVIIVLAGSIVSIESNLVIYGSAVSAILVGMILNGFSFSTALNIAWNGFTSSVLGSDVPAILATMVKLGGMNSMLSGIIFIILSLICAGTLSYLHAFDLLKSTFEKKKTVGSLNFAAAIYTMLVTLVTCDVSPTFAITSESLPQYYAKLGVSPKKVLDVVQCNSRFLTSLIPWAYNAVYMASLYSLTVWDYLPWAFFFPLCAICQIILTFFGVGVHKITEEEAERFQVPYTSDMAPIR